MSMSNFILAILSTFILVVGFNYWFLKYHRRSIWSGVFFSVGVVIAFVCLVLLITSTQINIIIVITGVLSALAVISIPFLLLGFFVSLFYSTIQLTRKEGLTPTHMLSLFVALLIIIYFYIGGYNATGPNQTWVNFFANCLAFYISYFFIMLFFFAVGSLVNIYYPKQKTYDYIIILGAGLIKDKITPLLKSRIDLGIKEYNRIKSNGKTPKIIVSGGQGNDEKISEGEAMGKYLLEQNIPQEDIIVENKSLNTYQNLLYSKQLMLDQNASNLIITNKFHLFRALLLSKKLKMDSDGAGSKTKLYFSLNALIREFVGVIVLHKKLHITIIVFVTMVILFNKMFVIS